MKVIEVKNVTKNYKKFTLNNISFDVEEGEIIGVVGENGAGKSTLFRLLCGLSSPTSGEIKIFNKDISKLTRDDYSKISSIFDEQIFPNNFKIKQIRKILNNIFDNFEDNKFSELLSCFELDENKKIRDFSKGMKVKLNLAIALSHKSKLFIFDEPTNGLDPVFRTEILERMQSLKIKGATTLISSHISTDLEKICDRFIFINNGEIVIDEEKDKLYNRYDLYEMSLYEFNNIDKKKVIKYRIIEDRVVFLSLKNSFSEIERKTPSLDEILVLLRKGENT